MRQRNRGNTRVVVIPAGDGEGRLANRRTMNWRSVGWSSVRWCSVRWCSLAGVLSCPGLAFPAQAAAQDMPDHRSGPETVENRVRPGMEGTGYTLGSLRIMPSVAFGGIATDDLYARRTPRVADVGGSLIPHVEVQSRWDRHALDITLDGQFDRYAVHGAEGTDRYGAAASGRIDFARDTQATLNASFARRIETRGTTGDTLFGISPIAFTQLTLGGQIEQALGQTRITLDAHYDGFHYYNRRNGDETIDLSGRDFTNIVAGERAVHPVSPAVGLFLSAHYNITRYPHEGATQATRRSQGYTVMAGLAFGRQRLLEGELAFGYQHQHFASPRYPTIAGFAYAAALHWHATPLTTISLLAGKTIQRSPIMDVAGIEAHDFSLGAAHELLRRVILRPSVSYSINRYRGGNRVDHYANGGLSATWQAAPHFSVEASVLHRLGRTSAIPAKPREYNQNRATITLKYVF